MEKKNPPSLKLRSHTTKASGDGARTKKKSKKKSPKKPAPKNKEIKPKRKKKKPAVKPEKTPISEKRELWNKNIILAGIVILLVVLNAWYLIHSRGNGEKIKSLPNVDVVSPIATQEPDQQKLQEMKEKEEKDAAIEALLEKIEIDKWKIYKNTLYSFTLKYPDDWMEPAIVKREGEAKYQFKVSFRNKTEGDGQKGFDILVYKSLKKDGNLEPEYTDNLSIKDTAAEDFSNCPEPDVHDVGPNKYPAIEVDALKDDPCFSEAYFFSMQKNSYIYDIVPIPEGGIGYPGYDGEDKIRKTLPEFTKMLSTFEFITVVAKKTTTVRKISAPYPVAKLKKVNGKLMCAKKNDKPHKSKKNNKGKTHMDMECCLDPDETPNPWCTY